VAKGTGSAPADHFDIAWQEGVPVFPRVISFLDFDQRHKGNVNIDIRLLPEDGPKVFGFYPFGNIGCNLMFNFHSGSPYTRINTGDSFSEVWRFNAPKPLEAYNASTLPWFYQLCGRLDKNFTVGPVRMTAYIWGINFLNIKGIVNGYRGTGRPDTDGWLATNAGKAALQSIKDQYPDHPEYVDNYVNWYNAILTYCGTFGWQQPREIRFGLKLEI
jgi:hypothetical protein